MSSTSYGLTSGYRIAAVIGLVCLSLGLPGGIVYWSAASALSGKPFGQTSGEMTTHEGDAKDGEVWFAVETIYQSSAFSPLTVKSCRIKRLDLETGIERETGLGLEGESGWPEWIGGNFYVTTEKSIYQAKGNSLVRIGPNISDSQPFRAYKFDDDGRLTTVRRTENGGFCLAHLSDGKWIDGRQIVLPGVRRVWYEDPQLQRKTLLPLTSEQPVLPPPRSASGPWALLAIATVDRQFHLMFTDLDAFGAYRTGFEFADNEQDGVSALVPENAPRESTGWDPINNADPGEPWIAINGDRAGLLFRAWRKPNWIVRRHPDGRWERLEELHQRTKYESSNVVADPREVTACVVYWNHLWGAASICRIKGNQVQLAHAVAPGHEREYLDRWKRFCGGLMFAWLTHLAVLVVGFAWLQRGRRAQSFEFGTQQVKLASLGRRVLAIAIDGILFMAALALPWNASFMCDLSGGPLPDEQQLAEWLIELEMSLYRSFGLLMDGQLLAFARTMSPVSSLLQTFHHHSQHGGMMMAVLLAVGSLKLYWEGRYGSTPGKWLLSIRTIRSTLRPCGFARALVRALVCYVDAPLLLTPIPAAISMLFSERWRRLGDRVADTIVIRTGSVTGTDMGSGSKNGQPVRVTKPGR